VVRLDRRDRVEGSRCVEPGRSESLADDDRALVGVDDEGHRLVGIDVTEACSHPGCLASGAGSSPTADDEEERWRSEPGRDRTPVGGAPGSCTSVPAAQLLAPLPGLAGDAGLTGDAGLSGESGLGGEGGDTGLTGETGLGGDSGDTGLGALSGLGALTALAGDAGESMSTTRGAGTAVVATGDGADDVGVSVGAAGTTVAADASWAIVVGTTTGADSRGTLASCWRMTPSGSSPPLSGAANAKPPMATPAMVPTVAATFQFSLSGWFLVMSDLL
jgi:hypothetical protein